MDWRWCMLASTRSAAVAALLTRLRFRLFTAHPPHAAKPRRVVLKGGVDADTMAEVLAEALGTAVKGSTNVSSLGLTLQQTVVANISLPAGLLQLAAGTSGASCACAGAACEARLLAVKQAAAFSLGGRANCACNSNSPPACNVPDCECLRW